MSLQGIHLTAPPAFLFQFPPSREPRALPPPQPGSTFSAPPFSIPSSLYADALDVRVPITIASVYVVTVTALNAYNRSAGNKPWAITKFRAFFWFVAAHNVLLAIYSGWTFVGMWGALKASLENPFGPTGLVGTVDSLCKIHGISGLGNAVAYNSTESRWLSHSPSMNLLTSAGLPDSTDTGRLWNEGLAFYGWFFYLSKFYEVLDTAIILMKGRRSSTLQKYHHAGAMMCMWAGIRYMSPPIWMFVFVNSGIHTLMYTYYTLTAFSVPIPNVFKRTLTTMQILQFLVGASYAALHSFISYDITVQVPALQKAASAVASATKSAVTSESTITLLDIIKKYLLRAVGGEIIAKNVNGAPTSDVLNQIKTKTSRADGITYHTEYQTVPCIDTNGQTIAIWLNIIYLAPLTALFVRFFVKSYLRRNNKKVGPKLGAVEKALVDAVKGADRNINGTAINGNGKAINGNGKANGTY